MIVDDQTLVREAFALLLGRFHDIEVVATAPDGLQALHMLRTAAVDVVLMDLRLPGLDGAEITRRIRAEHPSIAILILTTYLHDGATLPALRAGALGVIGKDATPAEVAAAIHAAHRRDLRTLPTSSRPDPACILSPRELEVVRLIAEGLTNARIADHLGISTPTVKTHVNNAFAKLGVAERRTAAVRAATLGLLA